MSFNHPGVGLLHRRVVSDHMNLPVAAAEQRTQYPTYQANDDRTEKRAPETRDVERRNDFRHQHQEERVNDKNKQAHRYDDERKAQEQQNGTHKSVDNAQQERSAKQRPPTCRS